MIERSEDLWRKAGGSVSVKPLSDNSHACGQYLLGGTEQSPCTDKAQFVVSDMIRRGIFCDLHYTGAIGYLVRERLRQSRDEELQGWHYHWKTRMECQPRSALEDSQWAQECVRCQEYENFLRFSEVTAPYNLLELGKREQAKWLFNWRR